MKKIGKLFVMFCLVMGVLISSLPVEGVRRREKSVEEVISSGFYSFSERIDIRSYGVGREEISAIFSSVIKNDPYLFFVGNKIRYSCDRYGKLVSLIPEYLMTKNEYRSAFYFCRERISKLTHDVGGSRIYIALALRNAVCDNFEYDENKQNGDIYSFLKSGRGTCQAYTLLYMALLREFGILTTYAASDRLEHIWNLVRIEGEWYHADLTWDDSYGRTSYRHFLCSDDVARKRGHTDIYSFCGIACSSEKYLNYDFDRLLRQISANGH